MKFRLLIKTEMLKKRIFIAFKFSDVVLFIMLINVKMPAFDEILTFMRTNFMRSSAKHDHLITSRPDRSAGVQRVCLRLLQFKAGTRSYQSYREKHFAAQYESL